MSCGSCVGGAVGVVVLSVRRALAVETERRAVKFGRKAGFGEFPESPESPEETLIVIAPAPMPATTPERTLATA